MLLISLLCFAFFEALSRWDSFAISSLQGLFKINILDAMQPITCSLKLVAHFVLAQFQYQDFKKKKKKKESSLI